MFDVCINITLNIINHRSLIHNSVTKSDLESGKKERNENIWRNRKWNSRLILNIHIGNGGGVGVFICVRVGIAGCETQLGSVGW